MRLPNKQRQHAFTIIELSIVIVVIGLIAGSIIIGQDIIRNSQMQTVIADVDRYKKATLLFQEKYHALPGDMANATSFWGADSACPPAANDVPKAATCNGNGDGVIGYTLGNPKAFGANHSEGVRAWQQLANAKLIEGAYSGTNSAITSEYSAGINLPRSKLRNNAYTISYAGIGTGAGYFSATYRHIIAIGDVGPSALEKTAGYYPGMSVVEARSIDGKMDDGKPGLGYVLTYTSDQMDCADHTDGARAAYVTTNAVSCSLIFITGF